MTLAVLDRPELDTTLDTTTAEGQAVARAQFQTLRARGYFAYREAPGGGGGEVVTDLTGVAPSETVVFVPQLVGG